MVHIITKQSIWGEANDFVEAINGIEENLDEFENNQEIVLVDFETKQTQFLKVSLRVEEY